MALDHNRAHKDACSPSSPKPSPSSPRRFRRRSNRPHPSPPRTGKSTGQESVLKLMKIPALRRITERRMVQRKMASAESAWQSRFGAPLVVSPEPASGASNGFAGSCSDAHKADGIGRNPGVHLHPYQMTESSRDAAVAEVAAEALMLVAEIRPKEVPDSERS
eukprot:CAMPEP_0113545810 /NCGR_PEP_ID=MMETSP0015_2-20120614/11464_1 /TAXON_ID=2838 /ORGANISM="Odontella" /LENGTH=162 /DNA_ID=CAMNT_0000446209 /DNA_START=187 /DNA_END=675 /DNA_ORIENTATION=- /assembly_acc=CAM_ASM_000160